MNKFAPLTKEEIAMAVAPTPAHVETIGEIVMPVPSDAPAMPLHPLFGKPKVQFPYHAADGQVSFVICRFDPDGERKQVLPLTLWRDGLGYLQWRWKGVPAPRPLYNLDKLAAKPDAPVVIVEGEKTADGAAAVFPNSVTTTSQGGSQAASKADWSPLAGRKILVWPDADAPGLKYARDVADALVALGCEVSLVDAVALAKMSPDGGEREIPKDGWDAADAIEEWKNLRLLQKAAALTCAKRFEPGPAFVSYANFVMSDGGLTWETTKGKGDNVEISGEWVCAPFEVLGATRDPSGCGWGKWLRWRDGDEREHVRHVADAALQGDPAALAASLAGEGLRINRAHQRALAAYLCGVEVKNRVAMVARTGWHTIGGRDVFVLPNETFGASGRENVILDASAHGPYEARGTLKDWQAGVGTLAADHALAVLSISTALAGPLLHLAGQDGGGVHFVGNSSKGKSTIQNAGASVWGRGGSPGYVKTWRATANGLEGAAASASDTVLVLDEMGMIEAKELSVAVYGLANGSGKQRAGRDGSLREPKSWRVMVISSGEVTIAAKLAEDRGRKARAGQLIRLLDIPADRGNGFGAFDGAGPDGDAAKLSTAMKAAAASNYGTAGPAFVQRMISEGIGGDVIRAMVSKFVAEEVKVGTDGQIIRAAERLALIAAAGELATALGVTPWKSGAARKAAAWALARWIEGRGGTEPAEARQAIEAVRLMIEQYGDSRFEPIGDGEARPVPNRLGWRKGEGSSREWWIPPQVFRAEVCAGLDASFVAKVLADIGLLRTQSGSGHQCKVNLRDGRRVWAYVLTAGILDGDDDAS